MKMHRESLIILILALIISFFVFGNSIKGNFLSDDLPNIINRQGLRNPSQFLNLFITSYFYSQPEIGLYRPLPLASYTLNFIFGDSPVSFHIINIILHSLATFMVFVLIKFLTNSKKLALISFFIFLLLPIHTEALAPIVGRAELLATLFSLTSIYLFIKKNYWVSAFTFLLAIFSKETALMTIPIIFYIDWYRNKKLPKLKIYLWFLTPLILYFVLRFVALGQYIFHAQATEFVENPLAFVSVPERIFTAFKVLFIYVEKLILPIFLTNDYSYNVIKIVGNPITSSESFLGILIFVGLIILMLHPKTRRTPLGIGAAIFFFPYFLISNLLLTTGTIMAERLMYFPSVGSSLIISFILLKISSISKTWKKIVFIFLLIVLILYGLRIIIRNEDLLDNDMLYKSSLKQNPDAFLTRLYWGTRNGELGKWESAKKEFDKAYAIYPNSTTLLINLGEYEELVTNNQDKAEKYYKRALSIYNDSVEGQFRLGVFYFNQQKPELAEEHLLKAISHYQDPKFFIYYTQTEVLLRTPKNAENIILKYFGDNPNDSEINYDLGLSYYAQRNFKPALIYLKKAKSLGNTNPIINLMITNGEKNNVFQR